VGTVTVGLAAVGSAASAALARTTIMGWTDLYITSRQIVVVVVGLFVLSMAVVLTVSRGGSRWRRRQQALPAATGGRR
jgi:hypothetical protein